MSYEPRGKVKALMDVMAPNPGVALPEKECAQIMGVAQSALPAYFDAPMRHGAIFEITVSQRRYYGITRDAKPRGEPVAAPAQRETTATGWKPPQMICTRPAAGTAAPTPAPTAPPAVEPERPADVEQPREDVHLTVAEPPKPVGYEPEQAPERQDTDITWNIWEDGDLDLHGLIELENGGYRMPAEAVRRLRKFIAWMPA